MQLFLAFRAMTQKRKLKFQTLNFLFKFSDVYFFLLSGLLSGLSIFKFLNVIFIFSVIGESFFGLGLLKGERESVEFLLSDDSIAFDSFSPLFWSLSLDIEVFLFHFVWVKNIQLVFNVRDNNIDRIFTRKQQTKHQNSTELGSNFIFALSSF